MVHPPVAGLVKAKNYPLIVGLTGGIASGKTTIADYLGGLGAYLIDTDIIAREVVLPSSPTNQKIHQLLGTDYFLSDGNLNRAAIKQRIFNDPAIKTQYEAIIVPAIRQATLHAIDTIPAECDYALLIVPLLFEKGLDAYTDYTISVDIPVELQIQRGVARNPKDESVIRRVIAAQMPREIRNQRADYIIDNTQPLEKLYQQLDKLHLTLCQFAEQKRNTHETLN